MTEKPRVRAALLLVSPNWGQAAAVSSCSSLALACPLLPLGDLDDVFAAVDFIRIRPVNPRAVLRRPGPGVDNSRSGRPRVGGGVAPAVLPHHRTYGSVYGGSV